MERVLPIDRFEDDLPFPEAVEDDGGGVPVLRRAREDVSRDLARQQMPHQRLPLAGLDDRAVAQDERQRTGQLFEDRPREVVAAPGGERHLHAGLDGPCDRVAVRGRDPSPAVEDGAIYVKGEEANRQKLATGKGEKDIVLALSRFPAAASCAGARAS